MSTPNPQLSVKARAAHIEGGFHPFQRQVAELLADANVRIIRVTAPVGSGKSRIIRDLLHQRTRAGQMVVLTYPTKILMESQLGALRSEMQREGRDLCVWPAPDAAFRPSAINVVNYSTDSLLQLLRTGFGRCAEMQTRRIAPPPL